MGSIQVSLLPCKELFPGNFKTWKAAIVCLHRFLCLLCLGFFAVILISACNPIDNTSITGPKPPIQDCRIVQHLMGSTCVPRNPQRVVTLRLDTLANSLALGVRPIASVYAPGFPLPTYLRGRVDAIEAIGNADAPNLEKILQLKPDLIVASSGNFYEQLSYIAPTVVLNIPYPPPSWQEQLREIARVLGKEEMGQQSIERYWQRIENLKQALGERRKTMRVSIANTASEYGIWSYGEKHFSGSILKDIGLERPESQRGEFFYIENISKEKMLDLDGDVLFFTSWGREEDKKTLEKLKQSPLWKHLKVFQRDRVYSVGSHWHNADVSAINAILDDLEKYLLNAPWAIAPR
ncbi:MAG: iron-siderophore ABC transporter substrate-binding protein [Cyanosarcina radialis HA8281-LM2]|jgi:iron complex transport system substrate-binding protein|nr:iron-siderophore ABC transporter substrate-binding protein [Cyanosarcina radialis HA8281-LM2]